MLSTQQIGGTKSPIQFNNNNADGADSRNNESDYFNHNFVNRSAMHPLSSHHHHHNHSKQPNNHRASSYMAAAGSTSFQMKQRTHFSKNMLEPLKSGGTRQ